MSSFLFCLLSRLCPILSVNGGHVFSGCYQLQDADAVLEERYGGTDVQDDLEQPHRQQRHCGDSKQYYSDMLTMVASDNQAHTHTSTPIHVCTRKHTRVCIHTHTCAHIHTQIVCTHAHTLSTLPLPTILTTKKTLVCTTRAPERKNSNNTLLYLVIQELHKEEERRRPPHSPPKKKRCNSKYKQTTGLHILSICWRWTLGSPQTACRQR